MKPIITLEFLEKINACGPAIAAYKEYKPGTELRNVVQKTMELDRFDWANNLLVEIMNKKQQVSYAIFSAELVIDISDDQDSRKAIEAAKNYLKRPSNKTKELAKYAAKYAFFSSEESNCEYSSNSSAAASCAAKVAAETIEYCKAHTYDAIIFACDAVKNSTDRREVKSKIIEYGLNLILNNN